MFRKAAQLVVLAAAVAADWSLTFLVSAGSHRLKASGDKYNFSPLLADVRASADELLNGLQTTRAAFTGGFDLLDDAFLSARAVASPALVWFRDDRIRTPSDGAAYGRVNRRRALRTVERVLQALGPGSKLWSHLGCGSTPVECSSDRLRSFMEVEGANASIDESARAVILALKRCEPHPTHLLMARGTASTL